MMNDALFRQDLVCVFKQPNGSTPTPTPTPREAPNTGEQVLYVHGMCRSGQQLAGLITLPKGHSSMLLDLAICHVCRDPGKHIKG